MTAPERARSRPAVIGYRGLTAHTRFTPFRRGFRQRLSQILIDLDQLPAADRTHPWFGVNRPALISFHERDHGDQRGVGLKDWARAQWHGIGLEIAGSVKTLCFPRILGRAFNPLTVHFGEDASGVVRGVIYEVRNTFGERHSYVARLAPDAPRHHAPKAFHVSPFFPREGRYRFRLQPPDAHFSLKVDTWGRDGARAHSASLIGHRAPLTTAFLAQMALSLGPNAINVLVGIHWHALWIWRRGARYHPKPAPLWPSVTAAEAE